MSLAVGTVFWLRKCSSDYPRSETYLLQSDKIDSNHFPELALRRRASQVCAEEDSLLSRKKITPPSMRCDGQFLTRMAKKRESRECPVSGRRDARAISIFSKGPCTYTVCKIFVFFTPSPLVCIFTQPPLLSFLTASAFGVPPSPLPVQTSYVHAP